MTTVINTIYGKAKFIYFNEPDDAFNNKKYHVVLEVSKEDAKQQLEVIKKVVTNEVVASGKINSNQTTEFKKAPSCYTDLGDTVEFKIHSQFKPKMFDRQGKPLGEDVKIWRDSTMWITYKAQGYNKSIGLGCTLYIQHGQIDDLVSGEVNDSSPYPNRDIEEKKEMNL